MSDNVIFPDAANAFTKALQVRLLQEQISGEQEDREAGRQNSNALMQMLAQPSAAPSASPAAPTPTAVPQAAPPSGAGKSFMSEVASVKARPPEQREAEYQRLVQINTQNGRLKPGQAPPNWSDQWADQYLTGQPAPANLPVTAPTAAPRLPVQSTPKIVGDDEAVARGLYDPLPGRAAPSAAPPVAAQPVPQAAPAQASSPQDRFSAPNMQKWAIEVLASGGKVSDSQKMLADSIIKFGQRTNTLQTDTDGNILSIDPRTNQVTVIHRASPKPTVVPEGGSIYLPGQGILPASGPKDTAEQKDYAMVVAQAKASGQPVPSFNDYQMQLKRAGATAITNDMHGEREFDKTSGKIQAERFNDLATDGMTARQNVSDMQTLQTLGNQIGTGKAAQFTAAVGPYAQALGINVKGLPAMEAYEAIVSRVAPTLRVKGSGAQSDFELRNFLKSLPSLGNTPGGNELIGRTMQALYQTKIKAAEIGALALNNKITREDAEAQLRNLPDPMEEWRKAQGSGAKPVNDRFGGAPAGAPPAPGRYIWDPAKGLVPAQ